MCRNIRIFKPPRIALSDLSHFGKVFTSSWKSTPCPLTRWPAQGYRSVSAGLGGGLTSGAFTACWNASGALDIVNSAVDDGTYRDVFCSVADAIERVAFAPHSSDPGSNPLTAFTRSEINYHPCGAQLFLSHNATLLFLLAPRDVGDNVKFSDFRRVIIPRGLGLHVDAGTWHAPPIPIDAFEATVLTKQSAVHAKVYYDSFIEDHTIFELPLGEDRQAIKLEKY